MTIGNDSGCARRRVRRSTLAKLILSALLALPLAGCAAERAEPAGGRQVSGVMASVYGHDVGAVAGDVYSPRSAWSSSAWSRGW